MSDYKKTWIVPAANVEAARAAAARIPGCTGMFRSPIIVRDAATQEADAIDQSTIRAATGRERMELRMARQERVQQREPTHYVSSGTVPRDIANRLDALVSKHGGEHSHVLDENWQECHARLEGRGKPADSGDSDDGE